MIFAASANSSQQYPGCIMVTITRGLRSGETVTALAIRILTNALPYLPTYAGMRESRVVIEANRGIQTFRDGSEQSLYRLM
ncbi:MAG: hypothetical protein ACR2JW_17985 [Thermomicrobiales bacterium]